MLVGGVAVGSVVVGVVWAPGSVEGVSVVLVGVVGSVVLIFVCFWPGGGAVGSFCLRGVRPPGYV